jgi:PqqD family protein of HPr-rel-A system
LSHARVSPSRGGAAWFVKSPESLLWVHWDDEHVLYHRVSGLTHFLNSTSALLLQQVLIEPTEVEPAARAVADAMAVDMDDTLVGAVASAILRFEELGLLERTSAV